MADFMSQHHPQGVSSYLACGLPVGNQALADKRLPHLLRVQGQRFVMIEPMLGSIDLSQYVDVYWVVLGSKTGTDRAHPIDLNLASQVSDFAKAHHLPFFVKQVGSSHKNPVGDLDGRT